MAKGLECYKYIYIGYYGVCCLLGFNLIYSKRLGHKSWALEAKLYYLIWSKFWDGFDYSVAEVNVNKAKLNHSIKFCKSFIPSYYKIIKIVYHFL